MGGATAATTYQRRLHQWGHHTPEGTTTSGHQRTERYRRQNNLSSTNEELERAITAFHTFFQLSMIRQRFFLRRDSTPTAGGDQEKVTSPYWGAWGRRRRRPIEDSATRGLLSHSYSTNYQQAAFLAHCSSESTCSQRYRGTNTTCGYWSHLHRWGPPEVT